MPWTVIAKRLRGSGLAMPLAVSLAVLCAPPAPAQVGFPAPASPAAPVPAAPAPARNPVCLRLEAQLAAVDRGTVDPAKADQIKRYEDSSAKQQAELDRVGEQCPRRGIFRYVQRTVAAMRPPEQPDPADPLQSQLLPDRDPAPAGQQWRAGGS